MEKKLNAVIQTLCGLFADKAELKGLSDWDQFIGCVMTLKSIAFELSQNNTVEEVEAEDGE